MRYDRGGAERAAARRAAVRRARSSSARGERVRRRPPSYRRDWRSPRCPSLHPGTRWEDATSTSEAARRVREPAQPRLRQAGALTFKFNYDNLAKMVNNDYTCLIVVHETFGKRPLETPVSPKDRAGAREPDAAVLVS